MEQSHCVFMQLDPGVISTIRKNKTSLSSRLAATINSGFPVESLSGNAAGFYECLVHNVTRIMAERRFLACQVINRSRRGEPWRQEAPDSKPRSKWLCSKMSRRGEAGVGGEEERGEVLVGGEEVRRKRVSYL